MLSVKIPARVLVTSLFLLLVAASPNVAQESLSEPLPVGAKAHLGRGSVEAVQDSPDGTRLAVRSSVGIWLYDIQTHEVKSLFTGHARLVRTVAFSPDGRTLASGNSDGIRMGIRSSWRAGSGCSKSRMHLT